MTTQDPSPEELYQAIRDGVIDVAAAERVLRGWSKAKADEFFDASTRGEFSRAAHEQTVFDAARREQVEHARRNAANDAREKASQAAWQRGSFSGYVSEGTASAGEFVRISSPPGTQKRNAVAEETARAVEFIRANSTFEKTETAQQWAATLGKRVIEEALKGGSFQLVTADGKTLPLKMPTRDLAPWAKTLGLTRDTNLTASDIRAAWRVKVKTAHPDQGGTDAQLIALNKARDEGLKTVRS
jgi:hypothetical protein